MWLKNVAILGLFGYVSAETCVTSVTYYSDEMCEKPLYTEEAKEYTAKWMSTFKSMCEKKMMPGKYKYPDRCMANGDFKGVGSWIYSIKAIAGGEAKATSGDETKDTAGGEAKADGGEAKAAGGEAKADGGEAKADGGEAKAAGPELKESSGESEGSGGLPKIEAKNGTYGVSMDGYDVKVTMGEVAGGQELKTTMGNGDLTIQGIDSMDGKGNNAPPCGPGKEDECIKLSGSKDACCAHVLMTDDNSGKQTSVYRCLNKRIVDINFSVSMDGMKTVMQCSYSASVYLVKATMMATATLAAMTLF